MHEAIEIAGSVKTVVEARSSLRKFKNSDAYRAVLRTTVRESATREAAAKTPKERRQIRLEKLEAQLELERLSNGEQLDEFSGLFHLPDPLRRAY